MITESAVESLKLLEEKRVQEPMITVTLSAEDWINLQVAIAHGVDFLNNASIKEPARRKYYEKRFNETTQAYVNLETQLTGAKK